MNEIEKQLPCESKNRNSEVLCRYCRPRLRRLEFEVNEMKLFNAFLKEHIDKCGLQFKDADQNLSGALSSRRWPSMNTSPACFLNSSEISSNVPTGESLSPASKALVELQKKHIEGTEQFRLVAHKYNEMERRLHNSQDALRCSSKQTYELEKVNLELQMQLNEISQVRHSSIEDISVHKLRINQEFSSSSVEATLINEESAQVGAVNASIPNSIHDEPIPAAAFVRSVTCDYQRSMMPMPKPNSHSATVLPPNYCVNPPGFMHTWETALMSMPCVKMKAQVGTPYSKPDQIDRTHSPHSAASACESGWNPILSVFSSTNAVIMERSTPKKQQSSRQINTLVSEVASPLDHCRLKDKIPKDTTSHITKADQSPGSAFPNIGVTSPTTCNQSYDEDGSKVINVPKIISIRANTHGGRPNGSNDQSIQERTAYDAAPVLSPKSRRNHHHSALIRNEVSCILLQ